MLVLACTESNTVPWKLQCVKMFARTTAKYVEEKDHSRLEDLWLQPYVVLRRADISEVKQEEPELTRIKEEDVGKEVHHLNEQMEQTFVCIIKKEEETEWPCIKEEEEDSCDIKKEEEEDIYKMPSTGVPVKSLDEGQHEVSKGAEPPTCSSSQQMTREGDGDHCEGSQAAPAPDSDDVTKNFSCSDCGQRYTRREHLKRHTRSHTGEKPFLCSVCGQRFTRKGTLTLHTRT
ncbi:zinc finger protein 467-like [Syngnathus acus]|uniref:zinc finger protein 467-like n=1 Tax=Syngnathus acus TaxID=161584 RepID=UPI001885E6DF|nr:zinc finger protein 467-like [Syngnathus acus]